MLNSTAIKNPAFLAKVGRAMLSASDYSRAFVYGQFTVRNRRNELALTVIHRRAPLSGFEFFDAADRDVTGQVIAALRQFGNLESAQ